MHLRARNYGMICNIYGRRRTQRRRGSALRAMEGADRATRWLPHYETGRALHRVGCLDVRCVSPSPATLSGFRPTLLRTGSGCRQQTSRRTRPREDDMAKGLQMHSMAWQVGVVGGAILTLALGLWPSQAQAQFPDFKKL